MSERYRLPEDLSPEEQRAVLGALERYFLPEHPKADGWALAGRLEAMGYGALQARRSSEHPWGQGARVAFGRRGAPSFHGRADVR